MQLQHSQCELLDSDKIVDGERVKFLGDLEMLLSSQNEIIY